MKDVGGILVVEAQLPIGIGGGGFKSIQNQYNTNYNTS
jgi:hypothetical protein